MTTLDEVIAESPYEALSETFWMYESAKNDLPAADGSAWSTTADGLETTKIVASEDQPTDWSDGYGPLKAFRLRVSKPFAAPGFLAAACTAIADSGTAVLVISTFSYDYIFVRAGMSATAESALQARGFCSRASAHS